MLLGEDQMANLATVAPSNQTSGRPLPIAGLGNLDDEGDDFFGHTTVQAAPVIPESVVEDVDAVPSSGRGRRGRGRGSRGSGTPRGTGTPRARGGPGSRGGRGRKRKADQGDTTPATPADAI
jgi:hypothetical protein